MNVFFDSYGPTNLTAGLGLLLLVGGFAFLMFAVIVGVNQDDWTQVDGRCWVHTTQDKRVFGHDGAVQRHTFCESDR